MTQLRIMVIDDEPDMAQLVCDVAIDVGFEAQQFHHAKEFMQQYSDEHDVIVLDLMMPDIDGIELIRFLAQEKCTAQLVLLSGFDSGVLHSAQKLAEEQGLDFVGSMSKPFRFDQLQQLLADVYARPRKIIKQNKNFSFELEELKAACKNNDLVVHYQPQINIHTQQVSSIEALVRWQHSEFGVIMPGQFIEIAEANDMIDALTWCVLNQVVEQDHIWLDAGINLRIAVNMSAKVLKDLDLPDKLDKLVHEKHVSASQIILEVTETALMDELSKSLDILTRLRIKHFRLSIDDFGTGYSSLVQLHRAPFSEIKIDQSFVKDMEINKEAEAIVETIIMLAHKLGMTVIAEGIESKAVFDQLVVLGCDVAQGYFIAKPMPADELIDWINRRQGI